ncbi:MAG TPA: glycosyltransferase family 25 protein [Chthoniobacteraceae bacterium]|nr:glycosyltransferase family 25 protein [Chthoniobacteraceae bacterium]
MRAYFLNLDTALDRRASIEEAFARTSLNLCRIPAIAGDTLSLPVADYSEARFRWFHGRSTNPREVGCYLSHVRAITAFLETGEAHALICEDDIVLRPCFEEVLAIALQHAESWNVLRLTGLSAGRARRMASLGRGYDLCVNFARLKGAGAYVLDRRAASAFANGLLPMWLPFDHAIDREWAFGLRAAYVQPFPISQVEKRFRSSIQSGPSRRLSAARRTLTTYPYQAWNEVSRYICRSLACLGWQREEQSFACPVVADDPG